MSLFARSMQTAAVEIGVHVARNAIFRIVLIEALTHFQAGESTMEQRVGILLWIVAGELTGLSVVNKYVYEGGKITNGSSWSLALFNGGVSLHGFFLVVQIINSSPVCTTGG